MDILDGFKIHFKKRAKLIRRMESEKQHIE